MVEISPAALAAGCERAEDRFMLTRLRAYDDAAEGFTAVFDAFGIDGEMRARLEEALHASLPVEGAPFAEAVMAGSMLAGVLAGLLIADAALPGDELELPDGLLT